LDIIPKSKIGPMTRYNDAHAYLVMDCIHNRGSTSRKDLVEVLGIGEGSVRTLINVMKSWEVVETSQTGIRFTKFGEYVYKNIPIMLVDAYSDKYAVGEYQQGMLVRGVADKVTNGMAQRDIGVRNGSEGASVFIMKDGKIILPKVVDIDEDDPAFAGQIRSTGIENGDVFLLVGSNDPSTSRVAAISIALEML